MFVRVQLKRDGTRWRAGEEVKGKLANGVGTRYPSHYLGTWCRTWKKKIIRTLQSREQGFENPWLFFKAISFSRAKSLGNAFRENIEIENGILFVTSSLLPNRTHDKTAWQSWRNNKTRNDYFV